jgi:glycosyltransferase involved in cell wall biosynthesis
LRVLHVIAGGEFGGAETFAQDAITALANRGIEQHVITRPHAIALRRFATAGVPITRFGFSRIDRWRGGRHLIRRTAASFKADLVHAWMARAASFVPAGMPCSVAGWFGGYYDLKYYRRADCYIGVTRGIVDDLVTRGAPKDRVFLVHVFGTMADAPAADRAVLATPRDAPLILVMSRLHEKKGIDTILRAVAECPGIYLWLAGEGPERVQYEALSRQLRIDDRVRFLGWRTDRAALYNAADIVALPSRFEPFGAVIPEAWSVGKPLIATRAAGAAAYVTDEFDGLLCPIDNPPALASAIRRLLADPDLRQRLTAGGTETYRRLFTEEVVIRDLLDVYGTMLRLGKRSVPVSLAS